LRDRTLAVVLLEVMIRHEVHRRIDREGRIFAGQRTRNVGIVAVSSGVGPNVVVPRLETVYDCRVIAEVPGAINIIGVWIVRSNVGISEIGATENDFTLSGEQEHLRVDNPIAELVAHGTARGFAFI